MVHLDEVDPLLQLDADRRDVAVVALDGVMTEPFRDLADDLAVRCVVVAWE